MVAQSPPDESPTASTSAPPTPDECIHPAPVRGVMAHEFAHYDGSIGPEGIRRTTTYYGPVIGGLPIQAWHCETCGLLRLSYPDGRREERRLFPGPIPGLLAEPTPVDPQQEFFGLQPRVSGLSVPLSLYQELSTAYAPAPFIPPWRRVQLPRWSVVTWITVTGLSAVMVGLLATGILAVYDFSTPGAVGPVVTATGYTFLAVILLQVLAAAQRHWFPFPPLAPSIASTQRGQPRMDGATVVMVTLLSLTILGLFIAGILAVYTYSTSEAEGPVVVVTTLLAVVAVVVGIVAFFVRRLSTR